MRISNIQRFSTDDGPGIRTTAFLSGCNLHCRWCHNPETISTRQRLAFYTKSCIGCGLCAAACQAGAHQMAVGHVFLRENCRACLRCAAVCPAGALEPAFTEMAPEQVLEELLRDRPFCGTGSGVTFSGGEPLLQREELLRTLRLCKEQGLHVAVDTAAAVPEEWLSPFYDCVDLFLLDCKAVTEEMHRAGTGSSNRLILRNIAGTARRAKMVWIRVPVIPGFNAEAKELERIAAFLAGLPPVRRVELLPYHAMGTGKYEAYGIPDPMPETTAPDTQEMRAALEIFLRYGLPAVCTALTGADSGPDDSLEDET